MKSVLINFIHFSSDDDSDSDCDSDMYEDPVGSPGAQTFQIASAWIDRRNSNALGESDDDFYEYSSGDDDDADSQTEGEEQAKAREIRMQEVKLMPPIVPTDTETEVSL